MDKRRSPSTDTERLADFTDRLLAGQKPDETAVPPEERNLVQLEATLRSIRRNLTPRQPDAALQKRIRARLAAEWSETGPGVRQETGAWRSSRQVRRTFAAWSAVFVVALALVGAFAAGWLPADVAGTAQTTGVTLAIVLAGLGIIVFIFWWRRKKP
jgi:uncharacterized membrane protein (DUF485 family)